MNDATFHTFADELIRSMEASVITIGNEILIGQVIDTNSAFIGQQLSMAGIHLRQILSVEDREEAILEALERCGNETRLVFVTGGLGPTSDDITKPAICRFFGCGMKEDPGVLEHIRKLLGQRGVVLNERNRLQSMVPELARVVHNRSGTAPALWIEKGATHYFFMPGVPFEMKTILTEELLPLLHTLFTLPVILHRTVLTQGIAESMLAEQLHDFEEALPGSIRIAYLPSPGQVRLRLTANGTNAEALEVLLSGQVEKLRELLGRAIFGYDDQKIEQLLGKLLSERNKQLATAESCTGGAIAAAITSVPGSSRYFKGSVVAYSNEIKCGVLQVDPELIAEKGAVSREVVSAMAEGVRRLSGADYAIATSGIAGPEGGTADKPVGTIWIAVTDGQRTETGRYQFGEDRGRNITRSVHAAIHLLMNFIN